MGRTNFTQNGAKIRQNGVYETELQEGKKLGIGRKEDRSEAGKKVGIGRIEYRMEAGKKGRAKWEGGGAGWSLKDYQTTLSSILPSSLHSDS